MPAPNLVPLPDDLYPVWEPKTPRKPVPLSAGQARTLGNKRAEDAAGSVPVVGGVLRQGARFLNVLASPDTKTGVVTGPINGISKLGNALGDVIQGKPVDTSDAWVITPQQARQYSPFRIGYGQEVTPSDRPGLEVGGAIGAEVLGAFTGATILGRIKQTGQVMNALRNAPLIRRAVVAQQTSQKARTGLGLAKGAGEVLGSTMLAAPFVDQDGGNAADAVKQFTGVELPGTTSDEDTYLQKLGKGLLVEGLALPLSVIGLGSAFGPTRRLMGGDGIKYLDDLATADLAPYLPKRMDQLALPPAHGSAIERQLDEATQIRQVTEQRQRLEDMGLVQQGEGGQLEFSLDAGIDPEIKTQVRQLQTQRGQLIKQGMDTGEDVTQQLGQIDQQIGDLIQTGRSMDPMEARPMVQPELDLPDAPDPRPELDTYLAHLDELSDKDLRGVHSRVYRDASADRAAQEAEALQVKVDAAQQAIADLSAREDLTDIGRKRKLTKLEKELQVAQQQLTAFQGRQNVPESLVGDQLQLRVDQQLGLDLADQIELPPLKEMTRTASEFGYQTPDDYRSALQGWNRDLLRKLASPDQSPEVAALVKLRTGRRVWQAKKQDIIDALVELSERRNAYLPPEPPTPTQLGMDLTTNPVGGDAPLLDQPADLSVPGMRKTLDADGNEVSVPMVDYSGRGMDAATRERLKGEILQRAIDNGEVQPPFSPLPKRPAGPEYFQQGQFADELLADETGQLPMAFAMDQLPAYKAGGKNADALIDEMRLRYEYQVLDAQAQRAQREAYLAEKGWDTMSWEDQKRLGLMDPGVYALRGEQVIDGKIGRTIPKKGESAAEVTINRLEQVRGQAQQLKSRVMEWMPGGAVKESDRAQALSDFQKKGLKEQEQLDAAKRKVLQLDKRNAAKLDKDLDNEIAKLEKQISEGQCNG